MDPFSFCNSKNYICTYHIRHDSSGSQGKNGYNTNRLQLIWGAGLKKKEVETPTQRLNIHSLTQSTVIGMYTVQKANWLSIFTSALWDSSLPAAPFYKQPETRYLCSRNILCYDTRRCMVYSSQRWWTTDSSLYIQCIEILRTSPILHKHSYN